MSYRDGQTATNPKTGQIVVYNAATDTWAAPKGAPGASMPKPVISPGEKKELEGLRANTEAARQTAADAKAAVAASNRLQSGPWRGSFLNAMIPQADDGIVGSIIGNTIGGLARITGAVSPQEVQDVQIMDRARNEGVLAKQLAQRGPQTESDASRIALTGLLTGNTPEQNQIVADKTGVLAKRAAARTNFLTKWANIYGLNGVDENGKSGNTRFDEIWSSVENEGKAAPKAPTIRRIK